MKRVTLFCLVVVLCIAIQQAYADDCQAGETKKDDCNTCRCVKGGWACTKMRCVHKRETNCRPGETFKDKDGCNDCTCTKDGKAACTLKLCV